jgi:CheY-like chemotaxis protein
VRVRLEVVDVSMPSILVADDDGAIREVVCRSLERAGYTVHAVEDGAEAIAALRDGVFDLVITDVLMPERDGLETIMYLRREAPQTKIIAISGSENDLFLSNAEGLGATHTLPKPFRPSDLLALVTKVLEAEVDAGPD